MASSFEVRIEHYLQRIAVALEDQNRLLAGQQMRPNLPALDAGVVESVEDIDGACLCGDDIYKACAFCSEPRLAWRERQLRNE